MSTKENKNTVTTESEAPITAESEAPIVFGLMSIKDSKLYTPSQNLVNAERDILVAGKRFADITREAQRKQAVEIYEVYRNECYKDSYKSVAEYLTALQLPSLMNDKGEVTASKASQMRTAGSVYTDANAPAELKALSWSVLGALGAVLNKAEYRKNLFDEVKAGKVSITTLAEAKDYVSSVTKPKDTKNEAENAESENAENAESENAENAPKLFTITHGGKPIGVTIDNGVAHIAFTSAEVKSILCDDSGNTKFAFDQFTAIAFEPATESAKVYTLHPYVGAEYIALPPVDAVSKLRELSAVMDIGNEARAMLDICDTIGYGE